MAATSRRIDLRSLKNGPSEWELLEVIGEGTYGSVYRGKNRHSGRYGAIKIIENVLNKADEVQVELNIFRRHSLHPNIADFYGAYISENLRGLTQLWMVLEYCEGGSVSDLVKKLIAYGSRLDESIISFILFETLQGVKHLHDNLVIHRDVKGPNILLTSDAHVKLIDFGVSAELAYSTMRRHSSVGTPFWMAPEVIACEQQLEYTYDARCDVWSLGITAIELADGEPPLAEQHPMRALFKIPRNPPPTVKRPDKWSPDYLDFIASCLVKDFEQRPNVKEILEHTFVNNISDRAQLIQQQLMTLLSSQIKNEKPVKEKIDLDGGEKVHSRNIRQEYALLEIDDLATLETLSDEIIMRHLLERYMADQIYTYIGDILLAVNPFKDLGIYGPSTSKLYQNEQKNDLPPHIFMIACSTYQSMMHKGKDQCCVISGESGAGKTVSANYLIQHLAEIGDGGNHSLVSKILQVNPLMEAFGNAQTVINSNSSRFGKYLELHFNDYGGLMGAQLSEYLLEKSRVVSQGRGERNFHILYYLIAGLDYHRKLGHFDLSTSDNHRYLNTDDKTLDEFACTPDMQDRFNTVQRSFDKIGFTQEEVQSLYCILAAVIHIGDIEFIPDDDVMHQGEKSKVLNLDTLKTVSSLLCIKSNELRDALTTNSSVTRGETITRNNTVEQAVDCRDATAKALYGRLFSWIVKRINSLLRSEDAISKSSYKIGILDIFGFENFKQNSFEQLCINIANEQLQFYFNRHVFEWEFEEYEAEGISAETIVFENNRSVLDLFLQKPMGMLALLDEESRFPKATDITLVEKFADNLPSMHFQKSRDSSTTFVISHYAGRVVYDAAFFLEKNRDTLSADIFQVLRISDDKLVRTLFQGILDSQGRLLSLPDSGGRDLLLPKVGEANSANSFFLNTNVHDRLNGFTPDAKFYSSFVSTGRLQFTVSTHFRNSLRSLLSKMIHADPHFVRCVRPNGKNVPKQFDEGKVLTQLRYTGVLETTKIRRQGFSHRIHFADFVNRYKFLLTPFHREKPKDSTTCRKILRAANLDANWRIGKTKVFLKYYHVEKLSRLLEAFRRKVITIQRNLRYYLKRLKAEKERRRQEVASTIIQRYFRGHIARMNYRRVKAQRIKETEKATIIQAAFRGYFSRKRLQESKEKAEKEERERKIRQSGFMLHDHSAHNRMEAEVYQNEEEQESIEETRIIFFLAQIEMSTEESYPMLQRTSYPVLYSLRKESDRNARKYRGTQSGDPGERILSVVDGVDDPVEDRIRWARERFESIAIASRTSPYNTRKLRADSILNDNPRPGDPFNPGAYRLAGDRQSADLFPAERFDLRSTEHDQDVEENLPRKKEGRPVGGVEVLPRKEVFVGRGNVDAKPRIFDNGPRESRIYPSRVAYETNGIVPHSRDEFQVTDFDWFTGNKKHTFPEPRSSPVAQRRPNKSEYIPKQSTVIHDVYPQRRKPVDPSHLVHYRPYNYLTGSETNTSDILLHKPHIPYQNNYNPLNFSHFEDPVRKYSPSEKTFIQKSVKDNGFVEQNHINRPPSYDRRPTAAVPDYRPHNDSDGVSKVAVGMRAIPENEPLRRPAVPEVKHDRRPPPKQAKDVSNFPQSLVRKFPSPKDKKPGGERAKHIFGFSYGIKTGEDAGLRDFQLRKTGRLQQLVPS